MHRLQYSVHGRPFITDGRGVIEQRRRREGTVQYYGQHMDDLPPSARIRGPQNADIRRTMKTIQELDGYRDRVLAVTKARHRAPPYYQRDFPSIHNLLVDYGVENAQPRDRSVGPITESKVRAHRKY